MDENDDKILKKCLEWWKSVTKYEISSENGRIVVKQIFYDMLLASVELNDGIIVKSTIYKPGNRTEEECLEAFLKKDRKFFALVTYVPDRISIGVNAYKGATYGLIRYLKENHKNVQSYSGKGPMFRVPFNDVDKFIGVANRYYKDRVWKISLRGVTIASTDIDEAILKLLPDETDVIEFKLPSRYISMGVLIPSVDFSKIKIDDGVRASTKNAVERIVQSYWDSGETALILLNFVYDWDNTDQIMAIVNESMPLDGYYFAPKSKIVWIKKKGSNNLMMIYKGDKSFLIEVPEYYYEPVKLAENEAFYTNGGLHVSFDLIKGFICNNNYKVPEELTHAFEEWVKNDRKGEVLK